MAGTDEQRYSGSASSAGAPGPLSRLLQELADAPGEELLEGWKGELHPGARVGRFEIRREVGRGGFGAVFEAFDTALNRTVAVKTLRFSRPRRDLSTDWARKEAEAVARLDHPCIVTLFDVGTCPSGAYLVMELLHGKTLAQRIEEGPIPVAEALRIAQEMAKGLAHAHQRGVLHRDLKPANVFLCEDGRVKLLDFGLANLLGSPGEKGGGTPGYMAPEQARGEEVDQRIDVFAVGKILGEMLGDTRPRRLTQAVASATSADPAGRPRDGQAWLELLQSTRLAVERPSRVRRIALLAGAGVLVGAVISGLAVRRSTHPQVGVQNAAPPSIAVLPFADMSPGKDQEYLADGVAEEILNALTRVQGLRVVGRTSSFWFKGKNVELADIGSKLNVTHVLEGSVRRDGGRIRITAQLVKIADGYRVWSETFDRGPTDIFAVEEEIARAAVAGLRAKVPLVGDARGSVLAVSTNRTPTSLEAHAEFLRGRLLAQRISRDDSRLAIAALERAIALDPGFAPAHATLSMARLNHANLLPLSLADHDRARASARASANRAVELDPQLPDGYAMRAAVHTAEFDWASAARDLDQALALDPANITAREIHGLILAARGQLEEAIAVSEGALRDDPLNVSIAWKLGSFYIATGRLAQARKVLEAALEMAPRHARALRELAFTEVLDGHPNLALSLSARLPEDWARTVVEAIAHRGLGHEAESLAALDRLSKQGDHGAYQVAQVHAWRGEPDAAFLWLERARAQRDWGIRYVKYDPFMRSLRGDPRYRVLLGKLNLPLD